MSDRVLSDGARALREWLDTHGKTQAWLAERVGVDAHQVWHWINGTREPRADRTARIEDLTGVPMRAWLKGEKR